MSVVRAVVKVATPQGAPKESDFRVEDREFPPVEDNQASFKSLYISPDPYQRGLLNKIKDGDTVPGSCVAEVIESKHPNLKPGDVIVTYEGWVTHGVIKKDCEKVRKFNPDHGPVTRALGVLGMPGMTAYFGLLRVCKAKAGEIVVVSGAAGAVGSLVGQIAK